MSGKSDIAHHEELLRQAMVDSDIEKLDELLSDNLIFITQTGLRLTKKEDLAAHRSGMLKINTLEIVDEPIIRLLGDTAVIATTAILAGRYAGHEFRGTFAYSRVWHRKGEQWQVEAGHCSPAEPDT